MALPRLPLQSANPQNSFFVLGNPNRRIALGSLANSIRGKATSRSSNADSPTKRKAQTEQVRFGFFLAEKVRFGFCQHKREKAHTKTVYAFFFAKF